MDGFRHHYNRDRPHQGIGNLTPAERYRFSPPVAEAVASLGVDANGEPVYPPRSIVRKVTVNGTTHFAGHQVQIGSRWAGARVRVIPVGSLLHVYYGEELVRVLAIDPDRDYQGTGRGVARTRAVT